MEKKKMEAILEQWANGEISLDGLSDEEILQIHRELNETLNYYYYTLRPEEIARKEGREEGKKEGEEIGKAKSVEKGIGIGIEQEKIRMAREMKAKGVSIDIISQCSGLAPDQIAEL